MVNTVVAVSDNAIACPSNPSNHPRIKNHPILPAWNVNWVLIWCFVPVCVSPNSENQMTILPTIARQVDTDAITPINNATPKESLSPTEGRY